MGAIAQKGQMIYITGASGFIGSHLAQKVSAIAVPHAKIYSHEFGRGDTVYFLSSYGNIYGQSGDAQIVRANIMAPLLVALRGARLVYLSTSATKLSRWTAYSRAKRAAEEALLALGGHCVVRAFTVIGRGDNPKHLVPTLVDNVLHGGQIEFYPWATHDYIDISDMVDGMINLAPHDGLFELGTGRCYTNQEVKAVVEAETGGQVDCKITNSIRPYDTLSWLGSDGSGRAYGWAPKKSLDDSIHEIVRASIKQHGVSA